MIVVVVVIVVVVIVLLVVMVVSVVVVVVVCLNRSWEIRALRQGIGQWLCHRLRNAARGLMHVPGLASPRMSRRIEKGD